MKKLLLAVAVLTAAASIGASTASASSSYICAYSMKLAGGKVTLAFGVTPRYVGPAACRAFNREFRGRRDNGVWGKRYCSYGYSHGDITALVEVRSTRRLPGRMFCSAFTARLPKGWYRV